MRERVRGTTCSHLRARIACHAGSKYVLGKMYDEEGGEGSEKGVQMGRKYEGDDVAYGKPRFRGR